MFSPWKVLEVWFDKAVWTLDNTTLLLLLCRLQQLLLLHYGSKSISTGDTNCYEIAVWQICFSQSFVILSWKLWCGGCTFWCPKSFLGPKSVCLSMNFMCIIFCCCNLDHSVVLCSSDLAFYGIYGGTGILFGLLALWLEKMFVILVTSTVGSLAFFLGE